MNPRLAALHVLEELENSPKRLENLLHQQLSRHKSAPARDRAQASLLTYTVMRNRLLLDHMLAQVVSRKLSSLDRPLLNILRLGAADLVVLQTPAHAAVNCAVDLAKKGPAKKAQGMVNGALRALDRKKGSLRLPAKPIDRLAVTYSHPGWMVRELAETLPPEEVENWLAANQREPLLALRVNTIKASPRDLARKLAGAAEKVEPHPLSAHSLVVTGSSGPARLLPGFAEGLFQVQDPGAAALSALLGVRPGMRVLDMCAGAGGKTGHLAALMENKGELIAVEPSAGRSRALASNLERLGVKCARIIRGDALADEIRKLGGFDRILVDAPCTGLGVAGRRPDVRWRRKPRDAHDLAGLQLKLARRAADLLAPNGAMLYCTCTITRVENQEVVSRLTQENPGLAPKWEAGAKVDPDGFFRTLPHRHQCDAFFAARLAMRG